METAGSRNSAPRDHDSSSVVNLGKIHGHYHPTSVSTQLRPLSQRTFPSVQTVGTRTVCSVDSKRFGVVHTSERFSFASYAALNAKCSQGQTQTPKSSIITQALTHGIPDVPAPLPAHGDLSLAFNKAIYSDRLLKMVIEREDSEVVAVREFFVNSHILSAKSQFFDKLFNNGMMETNQRQATLTIDPSEEYPVTELLKFMYSTKLLAATEPYDLLDLLVAADKFAVSACVTHCIQQLLSFPMTTESALEYLNLLSWTVLMAPPVKPLIEAAQKVIATHYRDISKHPKEEVMSLPFLAIEGIFSSDDHIIATEDFVYNALVAWTESNYSHPDEKRDILQSLTHCIRFAYISSRKLEEILESEDIKSEVASKLVLEALFFKTASRHRQRALETDHRFMERKSYMYKVTKLVEFEVPHEQSIVYLTIKREDCASLYPSERLYSQGFSVFQHRFHLSVRCEMDEQDIHHLGLYMEQVKVPLSEDITYVFSARTKTSQEFTELHRGYTTISEGDACGCMDLFSMSWEALLDDDSVYFIDELLHLRVDISIRLL